MSVIDTIINNTKTAFESLESRVAKQANTGGPFGENFAQYVAERVTGGGGGGNWAASAATVMLKSVATASGGLIGINDYGFKGKRQYLADRRYLLDLYVVAHNNADIRTATMHLRNEIFRRGIEWEPTFDYRCVQCKNEVSVREAREKKYRCTSCGPWVHEENGQRFVLDEKGEKIQLTVGSGGKRQLDAKPAFPPLIEPDPKEKELFESFLTEANYFGQSLETVLRECEDDVNVVDDAFIYMRPEYTLTDRDYQRCLAGEDVNPKKTVKHILRLDPVLVEFDLDYRGIPGMRHHLCVFHRDNLLEVPADEGWDLKWEGTCPECQLRTYPVYYKYNEQFLQGGYGSAQSKVLYLLRDEVIHWNYYTPSELYGYPPILSIYEKALTLIGMDRYLYDYFYERKIPQGIIATTTDDPDGLNRTKAEVEAKMQQDPHYIPWIAVSNKTQAGRTEFVRFAYSLDELNYLPIRDEIRERISGLYGVSNIWMADNTGAGGLSNESMQLKVMERVTEGKQRGYHEEVFPSLIAAFGIADWRLKLRTPEEASELAEIQIDTARAQLAQIQVMIGLGMRYDPELKTYEPYGEVKPQEEQQAQQQALGGGEGGAGGAGGAGGGGAGGAGAGGGGMPQSVTGLAEKAVEPDPMEAEPRVEEIIEEPSLAVGDRRGERDEDRRRGLF